MDCDLLSRGTVESEVRVLSRDSRCYVYGRPVGCDSTGHVWWHIVKTCCDAAGVIHERVDYEGISARSSNLPDTKSVGPKPFVPDAALQATLQLLSGNGDLGALQC